MQKRWDQLEELWAKIGNCNNCSLGQDTEQLSPAIPHGHLDARIMIVGEAAGKEEEKRGLPFCGPAGRLLAELLTEAGFDCKKEIFLNNCCCCRPRAPEGSGKQNVPPTDEQIEACRPFLSESIAIVQPKVICPVGGSAIRRLYDLDKIRVGDYVGVAHNFADINGRNIPCIANYHPAYLIRKGRGTKEYNELREQMIEIFKRIFLTTLEIPYG
jgi:DNA polymerase